MPLSEIDSQKQASANSRAQPPAGRVSAEVVELSIKSGRIGNTNRILSAEWRTYISLPLGGGGTTRPKIKNQGVGGNVGQNQKLSAVRQGAVYERAPARIFSRQAARLEGGHTQGSQGNAAASSRREPESPRSRGPRVIRNR